VADKQARLIELSKAFFEATEDPKTQVAISAEISKILGDYVPERSIQVSILHQIAGGELDIDKELRSIESELHLISGGEDGNLINPPLLGEEGFPHASNDRDNERSEEG
jgi:hypothetical protein